MRASELRKASTSALRGGGLARLEVAQYATRAGGRLRLADLRAHGGHPIDMMEDTMEDIADVLHGEVTRWLRVGG